MATKTRKRFCTGCNHPTPFTGSVCEVTESCDCPCYNFKQEWREEER